MLIHCLFLILAAILSGARNHRDSIVSEKIFNRMKWLFPDQKDTLISGSILLSNIYTSLGEQQRAQNIRLNRITEWGGSIKVGLAWTEVNDKIVVGTFSRKA